MNDSDKEKLMDIYFKFDRKRQFDENSIFQLYSLATEAIKIVEKIDKNSYCYENLKKAIEIRNEYKSIPSNKITEAEINDYSMKIIQLSQYPIREFVDEH